MAAAPGKGKSNEAAMESASWKNAQEPAIKRRRRGRWKHEEADIEPVGPPEGFHQFWLRAAPGEHFVMLGDYVCDLLAPLFTACLGQIAERSLHGRAQVVEGIVEPDPDIVKSGRNSQDLPIFPGSARKNTRQIEYPVCMVSVGLIVTPESGFPFFKQCVDGLVRLGDLHPDAHPVFGLELIG